MTGFLAVAGVIAPVWFIALVILQGLLQPDYSHVALPISALAAWPYGWIQNVNFYLAGALMAAHALGLHGALRPTRAAVGPALLMLSGVGVIFAGVFPMVRDAGGALVEPASHVVPSIVAFSAQGAGLVVTSLGMRRDPAWRHLASYTLASGVVVLALFAVAATLAIPDDAPLHPVVGLLQRVVVAVWFSCTIVQSLNLQRVARRAEPAGEFSRTAAVP